MALTVVIGSGAWGRACAGLLLEAHAAPVAILGRDSARTRALLGPAEGIRVLDHFEQLSAADLLLWAVPVQHSRAHALHLAPYLPAQVPMLSLSKGIEEGTLARPSEIVAATCGPRPVGCVSGPSLAGEVEQQRPLALVAAGGGAELAASRLHGPRLRVYTSADLIGVELCGALKNVIAIAAGMADGIRNRDGSVGLGDNARAALVTRGLAEIRRLGRALGADDATVAGLAGIGDIMATCASPLSRNRRLGLAVAHGKRALDILADSTTVAEGAWTSRAALALGERHHVELPISAQVAAVLWDDRPVAAALGYLLSRAPKDEVA